MCFDNEYGMRQGCEYEVSVYCNDCGYIGSATGYITVKRGSFKLDEETQKMCPKCDDFLINVERKSHKNGIVTTTRLKECINIYDNCGYIEEISKKDSRERET